MTDNDFEKDLFAARCREERTNGFQGCANKESCESLAYYLKEFSEEGLCDQCEFDQFPERFFGCSYCRRPVCFPAEHKEYTCLECDVGLEKWLKRHVCISNSPLPEFRVNSALSMVTYRSSSGVYLNRVPYVLDPADDRHPTKQFLDTWKGFYAGGHTWVIPDITLTIDGTEYESCDQLSAAIRACLEENGIFIHAEVQYVAPQ